METGLSFPKKNIEGLIWLTIASTSAKGRAADSQGYV
jgi:hypothetical protein